MTEPGSGPPEYRVQLTWTNNHGAHEYAQWAVAEIYGKKTAASSFSLVATISTWNGSSTYATQSYVVDMGAGVDEPPVPTYNYFKVRIVIGGGKQGCNTESSYSATVGPVIAQNPCTAAAIPA